MNPLQWMAKLGEAKKFEELRALMILLAGNKDLGQAVCGEEGVEEAVDKAFERINLLPAARDKKAVSEPAPREHKPFSRGDLLSRLSKTKTRNNVTLLKKLIEQDGRWRNAVGWLISLEQRESRFLPPGTTRDPIMGPKVERPPRGEATKEQPKEGKKTPHKKMVVKGKGADNLPPPKPIVSKGSTPNLAPLKDTSGDMPF